MGDVKPLRNLVLVAKKPREKVSPGGIILPETFASKGVSAKLNATGDYWQGRVEAVGPDVRELAVGDEVLVHTWAESREHGQGLYTGRAIGEGRYLIEYPDDIVCAVVPDEKAEAAE